MQKKPKMILFDYADTLLCEPDLNFLRGQKALFQYIKSNKKQLTPEQVTAAAQELFEKISIVREQGLELHELQFQRFLYEYLEIQLSISYEEAEEVIFEHTSGGARMPHAADMIDGINAAGIRSAVISNIGWSGAALKKRINRLLPRNRFEFILASSEYMFRKPNPMLFELALKKADLAAEDVWFCGDNVKADVEGSAAVGMVPLWYDALSDKQGPEKILPCCRHLHIHDWRELIAMIQNFNE